ncbi:hypothetical protein EON66_09550 [archaeon]|nr:MAG: hypothetical protein EON66_09550 [archaeon]
MQAPAARDRFEMYLRWREAGWMVDAPHSQTAAAQAALPSSSEALESSWRALHAQLQASPKV